MDVHQPLAPDAGQARLWGDAVLDEVLGHLTRTSSEQTFRAAAAEQRSLAEEYLAAPPESPGDFAAVFGRLVHAVADAVDSTNPGFLAQFTGGGLYTPALASFYTAAMNRYAVLADAAPALTAIEESVVRWLATDVVGLPPGSSGLLTSGGSMATFSAVVTARHHRLGEDLANATLYVSEFTHPSVTRAARLAGLPASAVRIVPTAADLRMDPDAAASMIAADRAAGRRPFLLVTTAGSAETGTVDPLRELADVVAREDVWLHVDAAYGGFFRLTARGRTRLSGMERADSVTLDPHKSFFAPYGLGALVFRDPAVVAAAHGSTGSHLHDVGAGELLPNYGELGLESSREARGPRLWLPLHVHGVAAFRTALDQELDLAEHACRRLTHIPGVEVPWSPDLSMVAFRGRDDRATRRILAHVNSDGHVQLSSASVQGRLINRITITSYRTRPVDVERAIDLIADAGEA